MTKRRAIVAVIALLIAVSVALVILAYRSSSSTELPETLYCSQDVGVSSSCARQSGRDLNVRYRLVSVLPRSSVGPFPVVYLSSETDHPLACVDVEGAELLRCFTLPSSRLFSGPVGIYE